MKPNLLPPNSFMSCLQDVNISIMAPPFFAWLLDTWCIMANSRTHMLHVSYTSLTLFLLVAATHCMHGSYRLQKAMMFSFITCLCQRLPAMPINTSECLVKLSVFITWKVVQLPQFDGVLLNSFLGKNTIYLVYFPFSLLSSEQAYLVEIPAVPTGSIPKDYLHRFIVGLPAMFVHRDENRCESYQLNARIFAFNAPDRGPPIGGRTFCTLGPVNLVSLWKRVAPLLMEEILRRLGYIKLCK